VFQAWVELDTREEGFEHLHDEEVFDDTGSSGAIIEPVSSGTRFSKSVSVVVVIWVVSNQTESGSGLVWFVPWDTLGVTFFFSV
jgi:hypothetical protein